MLGLPCGSTNGCTLNPYRSVLVRRRLATPGPAACKPPPASEPLTPLHMPLGPRSKTLSSHVHHLILKCETVSHQWGIPAAIFTFHGMYTLQVWPVNPPPPRSVRGYTVRCVQSPVLAAAIDQVGGNIGIILVETYSMHDNNARQLCILACRESHVVRLLIAAVIRFQNALFCNALLNC